MALGAPRGHITTGIFSTDKVIISHKSEVFISISYRYDASTFAMISGYPKRTAEVFQGATGEVDAAFDSTFYHF